MNNRWKSSVLMGALSLCVVMTLALGQQPRDPRDIDNTSSDLAPKTNGGGEVVQPVKPPVKVAVKAGTEIVQTFPSQGAPVTAWKINWRTENGAGLIISDAYFKKTPDEDWLQVLGDCRLTESFVPYHGGSPRFWDVSYNFGLNALTAQDCGPHGTLLSAKTGAAPTVAMELKDRGLMYKDSAGVRRGEVLILWGSLSAANYRYIIEYGFRDDGQISFRLGSTGHNYGGQEWTGHMHNGMWRIDVNLGGAGNNTVQMVEHIEPSDAPGAKPVQARTSVKDFNGGVEGFADFVAEKFTHLRVINTKLKNKRGMPYSYDLVPSRHGNARHYGGDKEICSHHDFWVTKQKPNELLITNVQNYVKDQEPIVDTDVVLWHCAAGHHEPRSEDGEMVNGRFRGVTPVMFVGFELKPRNIWDRSPFFQ